MCITNEDLENRIQYYNNQVIKPEIPPYLDYIECKSIVECQKVLNEIVSDLDLVIETTEFWESLHVYKNDEPEIIELLEVLAHPEYIEFYKDMSFPYGEYQKFHLLLQRNQVLVYSCFLREPKMSNDIATIDSLSFTIHLRFCHSFLSDETINMFSITQGVQKTKKRGNAIVL